jgi:hypothetical protein
MTRDAASIRRARALTRAAGAAALITLVTLLQGCALAPPLRTTTLPEVARTQPENFVVVTLRNDAAPPNPYAGSTTRGYRAPGPYRASAAAVGAMREIADQHRLREVAAWPIELLGVHCVVFELPAASEREPMLAALRRDAAVETAQPLARFELQAESQAEPQAEPWTEPQGERRPADFNDAYAALQRNLVDMEVAAAQRRSRGDGVRVALVDTGVDTAHPDFGGRLGAVRDFVADGRRFDERHGTAVAGVIAAEPNNRIGIAGIAPRAELIALRACWPGTGSAAASDGGGACNSFTLAQALVAALDARAAIVNLSLAGPADPLLERIVAQAQKRGTVFIGALPRSGRREGFPNAVAGVIAVDVAGRGAAVPRTLRAPGSDVFTLSPGGRYDAASGSSLAAASVTAVAALALALQPRMSASELEAMLARSMSTGTGVNACAVLRELLPATACRGGVADAGVAR